MVAQVRRLLLKLAPPPDVAVEAHELAAAHCRQHGRRPAHPPHLLHVTLALFGSESEAGIRAALDRFVAPPVPVVFDASAQFGPHLVLEGPNRPVAELMRRVRRVLPPGRQPGLRPHMTLVYRAGLLPRLPVPRPFAWRAAEIRLVVSHHGEGRHEPLAAWPLTGPEQLALL